jgi:hypothetical protein
MFFCFVLQVPAPLFRLVEVWLRKEFDQQMAAKKVFEFRVSGLGKVK